MTKTRWILLVFIMGMVLCQVSTVAHADDDPEPNQGLFRIELYADVTTATVKPPMGQYRFSVTVVDESLFPALGWTDRRVELEIIDITGKNWVYGLANTPSRFFLPLGEPHHFNLTAGAGPNASFFSTCTLHAKMLAQPIGNSWYHRNITFSLTLAPFHALAIELEKRVFEKGQDEFLEVPITIRNDGNHEDIYSLSVEYLPQGWQYSFSSQTGFVQPKSTREEYIYLHIPHTKIYVRQETFLVKLVLKSQFNSEIDQDSRFLVVTVHGFHLTLLQQAGVFTSTPISLLVIAFVIVAYRSRDPCHILPKPWREERIYLDRLGDKERAREKKLMKEEWLSAFLYCRGRREWEKERVQLTERQQTLQYNLDEKITREWNKSWIDAEREWKKHTDRIHRKYHQHTQKTLKEWQTKTREVTRTYQALNTKRRQQNLAPLQPPVIPKPVLFELSPLPRPKKLPKPTVPQYKYDDQGNKIVAPQRITIKALIESLKKRRVIGKTQKESIKEIGSIKNKDVTEKLKAIRHKVRGDITRAQHRMQIDKSREKDRKKKERDLQKYKKQVSKPAKKP